MSTSERARALLRRSPLLRRMARLLKWPIRPLEAAVLRHDRQISEIVPEVRQVQAPQLADLAARVAALEASLEQVAHVEQHLPDLLGALSTTHGLHRELRRVVSQLAQDVGELQRTTAGVAASVVDVWQRMELVRRETLVELRYGDRPQSSPEPRVVDQGAFDAARRDGLRLNLGCGHLPIDGFVNVDGRELPGVDVIAAVDRLPVEPGEVREIHSAHLLEHFPAEQLERQLLPYWRSLLQPGGTFRAIVPDAAAMISAFSQGRIPYPQLREVFFGGQEYDGDFHFNMFTEDTLTDLLKANGFDDVTVEARGRPNGDCLELQVSARRAD